VSDDFRPDDPDTVTVHYDLRSWDVDQRGALAESLANDGIPHEWRGDELLVPEEAEAATDAVFERLEAELGPFAVLLDVDEPATEFQFEDWSAAELATLREALADAEIPHRWEGAALFVASDAEGEVDDLLDAIEAGDVASTEGLAPDGVLAELFSIGDRLVRSVDDAEPRMRLFGIAGELEPESPPYGIAVRTWSAVVEAVRELEGAFKAEPFEPEAIANAARGLRDLCRPWV
jgi:hypothetical protein